MNTESYNPAMIQASGINLGMGVSYIHSLLSAKEHIINIERIANYVSIGFDTTIEDIKATGKGSVNLSNARMAIMYIATEYFDIDYIDVAKYLNKNRTMKYHALKVMNNYFDTDITFKNKIEKIIYSIKRSL